MSMARHVQAHTTLWTQELPSRLSNQLTLWLTPWSVGESLRRSAQEVSAVQLPRGRCTHFARSRHQAASSISQEVTALGNPGAA